MYRLVSSRELLWQLGYSLVRLSFGVSIGVLMGVSASMALALFSVAYRHFGPTLRFVAGVPIVLWMPFCAMLLGIGELFKISLTAVNTAIVVYVLTFQALRNTERKYTEIAAMYEKTAWQRIWQVLMPSALPAIFAGSRTALALGWIVLFFVEYGSSKAGQEGLAWFIANARAVGRIEDEFAGLLFLGLIALAADSLLAVVQRRALHWLDVPEVAEPQETV
jgi:sulfonate transport system permease protein